MLAYGPVHADLSAYNVVYWEGELKVIDFPRAVDARANPNAFFYFRRDLDHLGQCFERYRVFPDLLSPSWDLWERHTPTSQGSQP